MLSLQILLVDDEKIVHSTLTDYLKDVGHQVKSAYNGQEALQELEGGHDFHLVLVDVRMPGMNGLELLEKVQSIDPDLAVVIITGHGNFEMAIQALRMGAADFLPKPIKFLELEAVLEKATRIRELRQGQRRLKETIRSLRQTPSNGQHLQGKSDATKDVLEQIMQVAEADVETVLITGETGTGKEVVAQELHFQSASAEQPFIAVNCPALPENLVESELFGHTKGAFTGAATNRAGYFELANGGTLFLDEIADLSAAAQAKLLRVLETRQVRRVGGAREIPVQVRVIAATNVPLESLIEEGRFREDLYYRLNLFTIHLLPLRERPQDILPLSEHFLAQYANRRNKTYQGFSKEANDVLLSYNYPGNVRELRNIVERAAILCKSELITPDHIVLPHKRPNPKPASDPSPPFSGVIDERTQIVQALENAKWNRRQAALDLDMPYSTLRYKMQRLNIS